MTNKIWYFIENIAYKIIKLFYQIFHKELSEQMFHSYMQFVKFGIVGVSNTLVSYVVYLISYLFMEKYHLFPNLSYLISQVIAFILSVLWSFYWNNKMVFKEEETVKRVWWKTLIKTYISYSFTGLFLNSILIVIWVKALHVSELFAPVLNIAINVPINFIINKFWAYK